MILIFSVSNRTPPLLLSNNPAIDVACFLGEGDADFEEGVWVRGEWECISLLVNLDEGFFGCAVELQFDDVYVAFCLDKEVDAPGGGAVLCLHCEAHQLEDDVYVVLEIYFRFVLGEVVGYVGEKRLKSRNEAVGIAAYGITAESPDVLKALASSVVHVYREQVLEKAFAHFSVWKTKTVDIHLLVIALQREVTGLEEKGDRGVSV